ncbi:MAG: alpha/beta hydrolase [Verrucomicrobiota bacterium]
MKKATVKSLLLTLLVVAVHGAILSRTLGGEHLDIQFAEVNGHSLKLDLTVPDDVANPPLVIYIHGGGWQKGSYKRNHLSVLPEHGFAVASIGYRLTDVASFPAQIHDCKGAVRWLRANAEKYGYNAEKIGVVGTSAGGHLALLLGTSGDLKPLEGTVGGNADQSSRVQAIINYYGPSDFLLRSKTQPAKTENPAGSVYKLLGGKASENPTMAKLASGAWHVTEDDPPLLNIHGKKDKTVLFDQAERIKEVYEAAELPLEFIAPEDSGHGGKEFFSGELLEKVVAFLRKNLK